MSDRKTFDDLIRMKSPVIPGTWAAQAMGMDTGRFLEYARTGQLPFNVLVSGSHVKVARVPFLRYWGCTDEEIKNRRLKE